MVAQNLYIKIKRGLKPTKPQDALLLLTGLVFLSLIGYAIYEYLKPTRGSKQGQTSSSLQQAEQGDILRDRAQGIVNQKQALAFQGRENPESIKNPIPWFTTRTMEGFRCVRCSDTGAKDNVLNDSATMPVMTTCSSMKTLQWNRGQAWRNTMTQLGYEIGNYILNENADPQQGQAACRDRCALINQGKDGIKYGTCDAYSYDKISGRCHYFFNCDEVVKDDNYVSEFVGAWDINKQPNVQNFDDKYP